MVQNHRTAGDKSWVAGVELAIASEPPGRGLRSGGVDPGHPRAEVEDPHPIPLPQGEVDDFCFSPGLEEKQGLIRLSPWERVPEGRVRVARPAQQNKPARTRVKARSSPSFHQPTPGL